MKKYSLRVLAFMMSWLFIGMAYAVDSNMTQLIYDDFEDGYINPAYWIYGGNNVVESNNIIDIHINVTDGGGWLKTVDFEPADYIEIEVKHYMHPGGTNFFPTFYFKPTNSAGDIYVEYQKSGYSGNYCYNSNNYNKIVIKDSGVFGYNCIAVSEVSASDYYDKWITSFISYDSSSGDITIDVGNDGIIELIGTLPVEKRFPIESLSITSSGWYTGHYHKLDWISVKTKYNCPTYFCTGFQSPLANGAVKVKKNRVIPVKAQLFNDTQIMKDIDIVSLPVIQVTYQSIPEATAIDVTDEAYAVGFGTEGNAFEYNAVDEVWQFNLKTKNYTAPGTYTITMKSGDETEYFIDTCEAEFVIE